MYANVCECMRMTAEKNETKRAKITEQWPSFFEHWYEKCKIDSDYELKPDSAYLLLSESHHHRYRQWNNQ